MIGNTSASRFSPAAGRLAALALLGAPLLLANLAMPYFADDFCRAIGAGPAAALGETASEYTRWTGRAAVTFATYLLLGDARAPSPAFDILNTLAFLALVALVSHLVRRLPSSPFRGQETGALAGFTETIFLGLALWWLPWSIGEVALWTTGSIGYLWAVVAELGLVALALLARSLTAVFWLAPLAFVAGSLFEPLSVVVFGGLTGLCLHRRRQGRPVLALVLATLAHGLGLATTVLAPGNFVRAGMLPPHEWGDRPAAVLDLAGRLFDLGWLVPLGLLALPLLLARNSAGASLAVLRRRATWVLPLGALLYLLLHLALPAPTIVPRLGFPASIALAGFLFLLFLHRARTPASEPIMAGAVVLALLGTAAYGAVPLGRLATIGAEWRAAVAADPDGILEIPDRRLDGSRIHARGPAFFVGLERHPGEGYNRCFAEAFDLRSVRTVP